MDPDEKRAPDAGKELSDEEIEELARGVTATAAKPDGDKKDPPDGDLATDEETQQWLDEVIQVPEIRQVIREAARAIAERSTKTTVKEAVTELETRLSAQIAEIGAKVSAGRITPKEGEAQVTEAAEELDSKVRAELDRLRQEEERQKTDSEREQKIKTRELEAYKKEKLAGLDPNSFIAEAVYVLPGDTEDDIDDRIEAAQAAVTKIRRKLISQLRQLGWKGPDDKDPPSPSGGDKPDEATTPPTRDRRQTDGLDPDRRQSLRDRFKYGKDRQPA